MSGWKKLAQAAAASGEALNVEDVFSTYVYEGNSSTQTITNGIDLDGEGGLVWVKSRTHATSHALHDSERGVTNQLRSNYNSPEFTSSTGVLNFYSDGFQVGGSTETGLSNYRYVSWTFRKAPKFFDVVTYTGNGTGGRTISHNLGSTPGCIIVKSTSDYENWRVYHRGISSTPEESYLSLNSDYAPLTASNVWNNTAPTSTEFTVGSGSTVNKNGETYVAYLFAHNNSDGEFGPTGDQDIIKCGSYTGDGTTNETKLIDIGFEPQWVIIRRLDSYSDWHMFDNMRGAARGTSGNQELIANGINAEQTTSHKVSFRPEGFVVAQGQTNTSSTDYIYIAIRRGPMAVPESATDVFNPTYAYEFDIEGNTSSSNGIHGYLGNPTDLYIQGYLSGSSLNAIVRSRLTGGNYIVTQNDNKEVTSSLNFWDNNVGSGFESSNSQNTSLITWNWRRAPEFLDIVTYRGDGTANQTFNHNLGVKPSMVWIKNLSRTASGSTSIFVWLDDSITTLEGRLSNNDDFGVNVIGTVTDTTVQTLYTNQWATNYNGDNYIAYLFGSLDGVSKVGSYTGNGSSQVIDCGFSSGARFVLIKRTDSTGSWCAFDSKRGIVAGNDPVLYLQLGNAQVTSIDWIDPHNSGFEIVTSQANINASGGSYIFYAIA